MTEERKLTQCEEDVKSESDIYARWDAVRKGKTQQQQESIAFQTWLPSCNCNNGIISLDGAIYCRWCRALYVKSGLIDYRLEHFPKKGEVVIPSKSVEVKE